MKCLSLILALVVPIALSAPLIERQTTPVQAVGNILAILETDAGQNEGAITTATANAKNNVNAAVSVAAAVNANLQAIADGFVSAAASIVNALAQAGAAAGGQVQALSQAEIDALTADLDTLEDIISGISATLDFEATNLVPAARVAVAAEIAVVKAAIAPVVNPVMVFADAASKASAKLGVDVTGLAGAYAGASAIIKRFAATNGLTGISFPGS